MKSISVVMKKTYIQLSREERDKIAIWRAEGSSLRVIAKRLHRSHSTVIRELRRNAAPVNTGYYLPSSAHERATTRKQTAGVCSKMQDPTLRWYVVTRLLWGWSPELIAGRLRKDLPGSTVSHETIYRYIYEEALHLRRYLPRHHRIRWKKGRSRKHQRCHIPHRVPITERAPQVNQRMRFGHWEADMMEGLRTEQSALNVLVERKSRMTRITKMPDRTAASTRHAITQQLSAVAPRARRSVTYDNGHENTEHFKVNRALKIRSYFCEPYRSWEKGTVEHTIGLIRRFIPKGRNLTMVRPHFIARIEDLLNHRPRKCLDFATPTEVFEKIGGALPP